MIGSVLGRLCCCCGFIAERYKQVQDFNPEPFWKLKCTKYIMISSLLGRVVVVVVASSSSITNRSRPSSQSPSGSLKVQITVGYVLNIIKLKNRYVLNGVFWEGFFVFVNLCCWYKFLPRAFSSVSDAQRFLRYHPTSVQEKNCEWKLPGFFVCSFCVVTHIIWSVLF